MMNVHPASCGASVSAVGAANRSTFRVAPPGSRATRTRRRQRPPTTPAAPTARRSPVPFTAGENDATPTDTRSPRTRMPKKTSGLTGAGDDEARSSGDPDDNETSCCAARLGGATSCRGPGAARDHAGRAAKARGVLCRAGPRASRETGDGELHHTRILGRSTTLQGGCCASLLLFTGI